MGGSLTSKAKAVRWPLLGAQVLAIFGTIHLLLEFTSLFLTEDQKRDLAGASIPIVLASLAACAIWAIYAFWTSDSYRRKIKDKDVFIGVKIGSLLDHKGAIATAVDRDLTLDIQNLERGSALYKFLDSLPQNNDFAAKASQHRSALAQAQQFAATDPMPDGMCIHVQREADKSISSVYLLSCCTIVEGRSTSDDQRVVSALPGLWNTVRSTPGLDEVGVPIIGTGLANVQATREEMIDAILKTFCEATEQGMRTTGLTIYVLPKVIADGTVRFSHIRTMIDYYAER